MPVTKTNVAGNHYEQQVTVRENKQANMLRRNLYQRTDTYARAIDSSTRRLVSFLSMRGVNRTWTRSVRRLNAVRGHSLHPSIIKGLRDAKFDRAEASSAGKAIRDIINGWASWKDVTTIEQREEVMGATGLGQLWGHSAETIIRVRRQCDGSRFPRQPECCPVQCSVKYRHRASGLCCSSMCFLPRE